MNVHGAAYVTQMEMDTAEFFVPECSVSEVEVAISKMETYKLPVAYRFQHN
jgi:hypothetical protein